MSGNEAIARGVVEAGASLAVGYPGTPSSEVIDTLRREYSDKIEARWCVNEKVAFEIALGASWSGLRAIATMKMSGLNVASDSFLSAVYSGSKGGLLLYVADDPGVHAGMVEQDTRHYALMGLCPVLEPSTPAEAKELVKRAFKISEDFETPIMVRGTTSLAHSEEPVELGEIPKEHRRVPPFTRDLDRYTKAGSARVLRQKKEAIRRLEKLERWIEKEEFYEAIGDGIDLIITAGVPSTYVKEIYDGKILRLYFSFPLPREKILEEIQDARKVLVVEELDPVVEIQIRSLLQREGISVDLYGKLDGTLPCIGEIGHEEVLSGLRALEERVERKKVIKKSFKRPITFCAGCPHRGTCLAMKLALRDLGISPVITGDIGCTILGMNPPFDLFWTEVSMGSSVGIGIGIWKGKKEPVVAMLGDSTFFHAAIPQTIEAKLQGANLKIVVMDNGWTAMTGHQPSPSTGLEMKPEDLLKAIGIETYVLDAYDVEGLRKVFKEILSKKGVQAVVARRECALQAMRRGVKGSAKVLEDKCVGCGTCVRMTACPAIYMEGGKAKIEDSLCNGCGICAYVCPTKAIEVKRE